jgi:hypothetical protein
MLLRFCLLTCFITSLAGCNRSVATQSAALRETTDWINDTYNPRPGEISYRNHGVKRWQLIKDRMYQTQNESTTSLHIENCVGTIEEKQTPGYPMASEVVLISDLQTVNMSDLDPSHIKTETTASDEYSMKCDDPNLNVTCDQADIGLHTRNDRRLIKSRQIREYPKLTGADHRNVSDVMEDSTYLFVNDREYLPRFVAALKKEIELCGGKPSAF